MSSSKKILEAWIVAGKWSTQLLDGAIVMFIREVLNIPLEEMLCSFAGIYPTIVRLHAKACCHSLRYSDGCELFTSDLYSLTRRPSE